jgi:hypothetical protein
LPRHFPKYLLRRHYQPFLLHRYFQHCQYRQYFLSRRDCPRYRDHPYQLP